MSEVVIRLRIGAENAHYGGGLVDGAFLTKLFGDVATELLIRRDGDEGLFRAYDSIEFLAPVYAGDFIEARGKITSEGNTSRQMAFEAWKVIGPPVLTFRIQPRKSWLSLFWFAVPLAPA